MSKQGYIKLYRQIADTPVWTDSDKLKLWLICLMKASHEERIQVVGNQIIELKPGQFITGRSSISEEFNRGMKPNRRVDGQSLFRWLKIFEELQMLNIKKTNKYSLVTVLNWNLYQNNLTTNELQMNNKRTTNEQQMITNKNVKNVKNKEKKENKQKKKSSVPLALQLDDETKEKKTFSTIVDDYTSNHDLRCALSSFVEMRRKMGGYTLHALELGLSNLNKLAINDDAKIDIVNQSIERSWKGFFQLKSVSKETKDFLTREDDPF